MNKEWIILFCVIVCCCANLALINQQTSFEQDYSQYGITVNTGQFLTGADVHLLTVGEKENEDMLKEKLKRNDYHMLSPNNKQ